MGIIIAFIYFFYSGFSLYRIFTLSVSFRSSGLSSRSKFSEYCGHWSLSLLQPKGSSIRSHSAYKGNAQCYPFAVTVLTNNFYLNPFLFLFLKYKGNTSM